MNKLPLICFCFVLKMILLGCNSDNNPNDQLKVMSYNIHIATPPSMPDFTHKDMQSIADVINREKPDLVALQEVDKYTIRSGKESHQAKDLAEMTGMNFHFAGASLKSDGEQGQAILSRFPIINAETFKLPVREGSDGETRSLGVVIIKAYGINIAFMSVHLDHRSDEDRKFQIEEMLRITKKYDKYPIIFGGDFNMDPYNENFKLIFEQFIMLTDDHPFTFPQINPRITIDFILINDKAKEIFDVKGYYTVDEKYASDHLPVVAELKIGF